MTTTSIAPPPSAGPVPTLPAGLRMGAVRLRVRDAARAAAFYTGTVGLALLGRNDDGSLRLGVEGETLIELVGAPDAGARPRGTTGLFHVALLVPDRPALAVVLRRLIAQGVRLGASDHLVSEALYLDDPDGNGIEIYRDRPESDWRWDRKTVEMATQPLDLRQLLGDAPEAVPLDAPMPEGTRVGHVHLQVGDLAAARRFYVDGLGFTVTTDRYPGALFVSAGGYHHHLGLNIWQSRGGEQAPSGSVGLVAFEVILPDTASVEAVRDRLAASGEAVTIRPQGFAVADPWGTRLHIRAEA
ncbi:catechol 2,3-dioxygenase [Ancylobacter aquaticus]|uniref:Catechol 2,3-dioxygenase n=1 Tax=Ancylobacter aquaticus TaxID=100 RepID=A0A4R1HPM7_ANCAQ|nr:VOC family protein [Ancylobacter aquaticus]TCK23171.1 catechol 2,3-dioxygenase [Ancylobacter aquaticus]